MENGTCLNSLELAWEAAGDDWSASTTTAGLRMCPPAPGAAKTHPAPAQQMYRRLHCPRCQSSSSKLNSMLLVVAALPGTDGPAGLQKL